MKNCKNCKNWKSEQSELHYSKDYGICVCKEWKFTSAGSIGIRVLDRQNKSGKYMDVHSFESYQNVANVDKSRYAFVTYERFCCIHHC